MPRYRVHRIKDGPLEQFRWAPHVGGLAVVKPKDYDFSREVEATTPYAVWKLLGEEAEPLRPGDLLELAAEDGTAIDLRIAKYIGFEPAQWFIPEPKKEPNITAEYSASPASDSDNRGELITEPVSDQRGHSSQ
jgi:hypothetical protein